MRPLLVTGATGTVGAPLVDALVSAGASVRAASRRPRPSDGPASGGPGGGVEHVRFDLTDPTTWSAAFTGVETVFLLRPPQVADVRRDVVPALSAARAIGVRHVVLLSVQGADRLGVVPHAGIERWLRASGMGWTFVRPSFFTQNLAAVHGAQVREHDELLVPAGHGRTAFVDAVDVAAVAAAALLEPHAHAGRALTPTGDEALTYGEVATTLSEVVGRPVAYRAPGLLRYARTARAWGMPAAMVAVTSVVYSTARLGLAAGLTDDVLTLTGRRPATVRAVLERQRAAFVPGAAADGGTADEAGAPGAVARAGGSGR